MKRPILVSILVFAMIFTSSAVLAKDYGKDGSGRFSDISDCWAKDSINRRARGDIFDWSGKFYPGKQITRIEFVILLHDAMDININYFVAPNISDTYKDMKNTDKGASQLIDLVTAGIIDRKGSFGPNEKLTREELIHYLINALDYATGGSYPLIKMMPAPFKDDDKIDPAYKNDIVIAQLLNIVQGGTGNMFHPKQHATRAEATVFIDRMLSFAESLDPEKADVSVEVIASVSDGALIMNMTLKNNSGRDVVISHPSSQKFDFLVYDAKGNALYQYSANKRFSSALTETKIKAGESITFSDTLDKASFESKKAKASYVKGFITGSSKDFDISADGYKAEITEKATVSVSVDASISDGSLKVDVSLTNNSSKAVVVGHGAGQLFDYKIYDAKGNVLYTWTEGKAFIMMYAYTTLQPGESVSFSDTLDKDTYAKIKDKISYVRAFINGSTEDFVIDKDGYKADVRAEAGVNVSVEARIVNGGLKMVMEIANPSKKDIVINHTSGQKFDFKIFDSQENILYTWSADKMFTQALTSTTVPAGKSVTFSDTLDADAFALIKAKMHSLKGYITGTSEAFTINKNGYAGG